VGFVVDKAAMGQIFSAYSGFPCQAFHRLLHTHHHPGLVQYHKTAVASITLDPFHSTQERNKKSAAERSGVQLATQTLQIYFIYVKKN
jgi:hypothetical protein